MKNSLSLRKVVEIRKGQETVRFDKFPYDQVADKSFSLLYESENIKRGQGTVIILALNLMLNYIVL